MPTTAILESSESDLVNLGATSFTVSFWVNPYDDTLEQILISAAAWVLILNADLTLSFRIQDFTTGVETVLTSSEVLIAETWNHVTIRYDLENSLMAVFINAVAASTSFSTAAQATIAIFYSNAFQLGSEAEVPPLAPSSLVAAAADSNEIDLSWTVNSSSEDGFIIERSPDDNTNFSVLDTVAAGVAEYEDTTCDPETTYYYRVRPFIGSVNYAYSNEANDTTPAVLPAGVTAYEDFESYSSGTPANDTLNSGGGGWDGAWHWITNSVIELP